MDPATDTTPATTVVPSQAHSIAPNEKEVDASSATSSRAEEPNTKPEAVSAGLEEAAAPDQPSDELVYPKGFTLATVLVALCLAVFLVALVRRCALFPHFPVPARQSAGRDTPAPVNLRLHVTTAAETENHG